MKHTQIKKEIWSYYHLHKRDLPWRKTKNPYKIWVSEIMLQQTQVARVIPKYKEFLEKFPTLQKLTHAKPQEVLRIWSGLGYNRRGLNLLLTARIVAHNYQGRIPRIEEDLVKLPGIGTYTARAILAFAFNKPGILVETNVRTVILSKFFQKKKNVSDRDIEKMLEKISDVKNPREWYWAMMDYGAYLKTQGLRNRASAHYKTQSTFKGSRREMRGALIRSLTKSSKTIDALRQETKMFALGSELLTIIEILVRERLVDKKGKYYTIADTG